MLAMVLDYSSRREEPEQATYRFADYRNTCVAPASATRYHENLARAFCLLHPQPGLGTLDRLGCRRQRRAEIQRSGSPEADLVECVLERAPAHTRQRIEERRMWPSSRSIGRVSSTAASVGAMSTTRANSSYLPGLNGPP